MLVRVAGHARKACSHVRFSSTVVELPVVSVAPFLSPATTPEAKAARVSEVSTACLPSPPPLQNSSSALFPGVRTRVHSAVAILRRVLIHHASTTARFSSRRRSWTTRCSQLASSTSKDMVLHRSCWTAYATSRGASSRNLKRSSCRWR